MSTVHTKKVTFTIEVPVTEISATEPVKRTWPKIRTYKQDIKNLLWTFFDMNDLEGDPYKVAEAVWPTIKSHLKM